VLICEKIVHARGVIAFGRNGRDLRRLRRGYLASAVIVLDLCIACCFFAMLSIATKREWSSQDFGVFFVVGTEG
jgi:hypothetical protein